MPIIDMAARIPRAAMSIIGMVVVSIVNEYNIIYYLYIYIYCKSDQVRILSSRGCLQKNECKWLDARQVLPFLCF